MNIKWLEGNRIQVAPPKKPKKLTGTRFASILGLNRWSTPFEIWCAVTRTYEEPFEDTKYTIAGKTIEPKQAQYMKDAYMMRNLITPENIWGKDYFRQTWGDFFPESPVLGGMWDYYLVGHDGKPTTVLEMKTTKRVEDWAEDIPEYYALQAALYAYLMGVEEVIMVCSFLEEKDYADPDAYVCTADNTITRSFKLHERYPNFEEAYVKPALDWWDDYVVTGISPEYDEKADKAILDVLRTNSVNPTSDISELIHEAEQLMSLLDNLKAALLPHEERLETIKGMLRALAADKMEDGINKVELKGERHVWTLTKSTATKINKKKLQADGLLEKYSTEEESFRFSVKNKEDTR